MSQGGNIVNHIQKQPDLSNTEWVDESLKPDLVQCSGIVQLLFNSAYVSESAL